jgi:hypothetical protein
MKFTADTQELSRRFNESEAVWRCFDLRRTRRHLFGSRIPFSEAVLDRLDWAEAERKCRNVGCVGEMIP